jgi:hypothetical protein
VPACLAHLESIQPGQIVSIEGRWPRLNSERRPWAGRWRILVSSESITGASSLRAGILPMAGTYNAPSIDEYLGICWTARNGAGSYHCNEWRSGLNPVRLRQCSAAPTGLVHFCLCAQDRFAKPANLSWATFGRPAGLKRRACGGIPGASGLGRVATQRRGWHWNSRWLRLPVNFGRTPPPSLFPQACQSRHPCQPSKAGARLTIRRT